MRKKKSYLTEIDMILRMYWVRGTHSKHWNQRVRRRVWEIGKERGSSMSMGNEMG